MAITVLASASVGKFGYLLPCAILLARDTAWAMSENVERLRAAYELVNKTRREREMISFGPSLKP